MTQEVLFSNEMRIVNNFVPTVNKIRIPIRPYELSSNLNPGMREQVSENVDLTFMSLDNDNDRVNKSEKYQARYF